MMTIGVWHPYDNGSSIGTSGSENGVILRDEVYDGGARITLERDGHFPFAITCGCCSMAHTTFFRTEVEAQAGFEEIKEALVQLVNLCNEAASRPDYNEIVEPAIRAFWHRF